ncbi:jg4185 [Pararge aegeria aegeria]|uniref:Jg4185 protein n=1 Tax=Pararge aegeria aegeria TaxID=348720 RepID=A0A8S4SE86_9NEOP|nr:jg4185 [Pararge aegeria aegeria]
MTSVDVEQSPHCDSRVTESTEAHSTVSEWSVRLRAARGRMLLRTVAAECCDEPYFDCTLGARRTGGPGIPPQAGWLAAHRRQYRDCINDVCAMFIKSPFRCDDDNEGRGPRCGRAKRQVPAAGGTPPCRGRNQRAWKRGLVQAKLAGEISRSDIFKPLRKLRLDPAAALQASTCASARSNMKVSSAPLLTSLSRSPRIADRRYFIDITVEYLA